jgi:hypothetical protein
MNGSVLSGFPYRLVMSALLKSHAGFVDSNNGKEKNCKELMSLQEFRSVVKSLRGSKLRADLTELDTCAKSELGGKVDAIIGVLAALHGSAEAKKLTVYKRGDAKILHSAASSISESVFAQNVTRAQIKGVILGNFTHVNWKAAAHAATTTISNRSSAQTGASSTSVAALPPDAHSKRLAQIDNLGDAGFLDASVTLDKAASFATAMSAKDLVGAKVPATSKCAWIVNRFLFTSAYVNMVIPDINGYKSYQAYVDSVGNSGCASKPKFVDAVAAMLVDVASTDEDKQMQIFQALVNGGRDAVEIDGLGAFVNWIRRVAQLDDDDELTREVICDILDGSLASPGKFAQVGIPLLKHLCAITAARSTGKGALSSKLSERMMVASTSGADAAKQQAPQGDKSVVGGDGAASPKKFSGVSHKRSSVVEGEAETVQQPAPESVVGGNGSVSSKLQELRNRKLPATKKDNGSEKKEPGDSPTRKARVTSKGEGSPESTAEAASAAKQERKSSDVTEKTQVTNVSVDVPVAGIQPLQTFPSDANANNVGVIAERKVSQLTPWKVLFNGTMWIGVFAILFILLLMVVKSAFIIYNFFSFPEFGR